MQKLQQNIEKILKNEKQRNKLLICTGSALIGSWIIKKALILGKQCKMNRLCHKKRQLRDQAIQEYRQRHEACALSEQLKQKILVSTVKDLKEFLYEGQITVKQLLLFFIERTLDIGVKLNLITEINFDEALKEAEIQDQQIKENKDVIYKHELFGIPISIKDTFLQKDFDCTYGVIARCFKPVPYDGIQVAHIRLARGIPFVRTNVPQLAMTFESTNNIFGRAKNPWNPERATGGSSGGEAALIAAKCSVLGIGSDIAGSIRIPAAFCGIYGLKPGIGRQTELGEGHMKAAASGMMNIKPTKGPLARSVDDVILLTQVLFKREYYDQLEQRQKDFYWQPQELQELPQKKLKIGYVKSFEQLLPPNCMIRGVEEACQALTQQGHEVVGFHISQELQEKIIAVFPKLVSAEGGFRSFQDNLEGEKLIEEYELMEQGTNIPNWVTTYILTPILKLFGQKTLSSTLKHCLSTDVYGFLVNSGIQKEANVEFLQQMKEQGIDALIFPGFGLPAVKHGFSKELPLAALYTWIWNTVDAPVGSMPVTVVQEGSDQEIKGKERSLDFIYYKMRQSMKGSQGLPVNVQIISYPYQEETILKIMKDIEQVVQFNSKHPYPY